MVERPRFQGTRIDGEIWTDDGDGNRHKQWSTEALLDHDCIDGRVFVATRRVYNYYVGILREKENGLYEVIVKEERESGFLNYRDPVEQGKELLEDTVRAETSQAVNNTNQSE